MPKFFAWVTFALLFCLQVFLRPAEAKKFDRCHLARLFLHKYKFPREHIDDCEFFHLSCIKKKGAVCRYFLTFCHRGLSCTVGVSLWQLGNRHPQLGRQQGPRAFPNIGTLVVHTERKGEGLQRKLQRYELFITVFSGIFLLCRILIFPNYFFRFLGW